MGAAAYNRGTRAIRAELDRALAARPAELRAACAGHLARVPGARRARCTDCRHEHKGAAGAPCPCTHPIAPDPCAGVHQVTDDSLAAGACARCALPLDRLTLETTP